MRILVVYLCCIFALAAADWPQFQGPARDGTSPAQGLADKLPQFETGMQVLWRVETGPGYGGAAVQGGEAFLLDREEAQRDVLRCFDLDDGKERWRFAYEAPGKLSHDGSRSTPTVTADRVYTLGPFGQLHCLDRRTHAVVWQQNLVEAYDVTPLRWGMAASPLLHGDLVVVPPQGTKGGLVALTAADGAEAWKCIDVPNLVSRKGRGSYATPVVCTLAGVEQIVFVTACFQNYKTKVIESRGCVFGVDPTDGKVLWSWDGFQCSIPIAAPTPVGDDRVFVTGAYGAGSGMLKVVKDGDGLKAETVFTTKECGGQIQQPLLVDGHLYVISNGKERREGLMCLALDGTVKWHTTNSEFCNKAKEGLPNFDVGCAILADGKLYIMDGAEGKLHVVAPDPAEFRPLGTSPALIGGKELWAPLALAGSRLLARDHRQLICVELQQPK